MDTLGTPKEESIQEHKKTKWIPNKLTRKDVKFATWIAFIAWVLAVYDFILFGTLLPQMGNEYGWSEIEQAKIATWVAVGGAIVAFAVGPIVDRMGRKPGLIFTVGGAGLCSLFTAFGAGLGKGPLTLIRSVAGLGYAEQTVNATYLTEMYAAVDDPELQKKKGFIYSLVQGGWPIGALIAAGITAILLPIVGWQGNFIFAAIPSFILIFFAFKLKKHLNFKFINAFVNYVKRVMKPQQKALLSNTKLTMQSIKALALLPHLKAHLCALLWFLVEQCC
jgi:MFS family permease